MNYQRIYDQIIERARGRKLSGYYERHHIKPRALGGGDEVVNLVDLTYQEHFIAHWLLTKICKGRDRMKMMHAFHLMGSGQNISWKYELSKQVSSDFFDEEFKSHGPERIAKHKKKLETRNQKIANKRLANDPNGVVIIKGRHYRLKDLH